MVGLKEEDFRDFKLYRIHAINQSYLPVYLYPTSIAHYSSTKVRVSGEQSNGMIYVLFKFTSSSISKRILYAYNLCRDCVCHDHEER